MGYHRQPLRQAPPVTPDARRSQIHGCTFSRSAPGARIVDPFPDDVRQFLEGHIDCLDQLEVLRILASDPAKEWSASELAREAHTSPEVLAPHLAALHARGLLTHILRDAVVNCRYGPRTPDLERSVSRLLEMYQQRPVTMIRMVYARANKALKAFVEAFQLRKED